MTAHGERDSRTTLARTRPWWCEECERPHDGTREDAHATLGERGVTMTGHAYAWCARESLWHVESPQRGTTDRISRQWLAQTFAPRAREVVRRSDHSATTRHRTLKDVDTGRALVVARTTGVARVRGRWDARTHAIAGVARATARARVYALTMEGVGI